MTPNQFAFVLDQQVGLRAQSLNIERVVKNDDTIQPTFVPVRYDLGKAPAYARFPCLPGSVRGTLAGVREIRNGLGRDQFDGILWGTWAAKSVPDLVAAAPSYLLVDMTPVQRERMGDLYGYSRAHASIFSGWKRRATDRLYGETSHLFVWSDWVADSLKHDYNLPSDKVTTVPPGVDVNRFSPQPESKMEDGVVRLLFVGDDFTSKGGDLLLRWARETQVKTSWELHMVTRGAGSDLPSGVHIHRGVQNNTPELLRLYGRSDLFVLPTRADCYSLSAVEAMASGLPVVISELGGIPEIVTDGETGYLVAPDDYETLASRVDHLVESADTRGRMGHAARARAVTRFDARYNVGCMLARMRQEVSA